MHVSTTAYVGPKVVPNFLHCMQAYMRISPSPTKAAAIRVLTPAAFAVEGCLRQS